MRKFSVLLRKVSRREKTARHNYQFYREKHGMLTVEMTTREKVHSYFISCKIFKVFTLHIDLLVIVNEYGHLDNGSLKLNLG